MSQSWEPHEFAEIADLSVALGHLSMDADGLSCQVRQGLERPLGLDGLRTFAVDGDRVVIAVHKGIPRIESVVDPLVQGLMDIDGLAAEQISLLFADCETANRFASHSRKRDHNLRVTTHEGTADAALALMGSDEAHLPILVNRVVFDADVLVPVVAADDHGESRPSQVFSDFVDSSTRKRWREHSIRGDTTYADQIRILTGGLVVVRVVTGPGDFPYDVIIGTWEATKPIGIDRLAAAWRVNRPANMDLIIASIDDRRDGKSWQAVRDAIVESTKIDRACPIVVISDLDEPPPNELRRLFASTSSERVVAEYDVELRAAIASRKIYFGCRMPPEDIRQLGMLPTAGVEGLRLLASGFRSPALFRDVQRLRIHEGGITAPKPKRKAVLAKKKGRRSP